MVSFDVDSLFTNVPVDETVEFLQNHLSVNHLDLPFSNHVLFQLINLCTKSCPFSCNDQYFKQIKGLSMGSCLSQC